MVMSMSPNDFVNKKSVAPMNDNKHPTKQELDTLTVQNMDDKKARLAPCGVFKKTPNLFDTPMRATYFAWGKFFILVI